MLIMRGALFSPTVLPIPYEHSLTPPNAVRVFLNVNLPAN